MTLLPPDRALSSQNIRTIEVDGVEYVAREFCREILAERDKLAEALQQIADTPPDSRAGWVHWAEQARRALVTGVVRTSVRHYALFAGQDLAVEFKDAEDALGYMAKHADAILDSDAALLVLDGKGMCRVALVDARKLPGTVDV